MKVFVYGTLLKGMERASTLINSIYLGPAIIKGEIFDLGNYPGIKKGDNTVIGELYEVDNKTIELLDYIEGYNKHEKSSSLYIREETEVYKFSDGQPCKGFTYFYNNQINGNKISHGDYRRYLLEQKNREQWIIAYGSNIGTDRLIERVGEIKEYKKGSISNFKLIFNKQGGSNKTVYANIIYTGDNKRCPAVAYKLSPEQILQLDTYEGVPDHYSRISILFYDDFDNDRVMQVYIANPNKLVWGIPPEHKYLNYIETGYKEHGFSLEKLYNEI